MVTPSSSGYDSLYDSFLEANNSHDADKSKQILKQIYADCSKDRNASGKVNSVLNAISATCLFLEENKVPADHMAIYRQNIKALGAIAIKAAGKDAELIGRCEDVFKLNNIGLSSS